MMIVLYPVDRRGDITMKDFEIVWPNDFWGVGVAISARENPRVNARSADAIDAPHRL
jgi:hypothetical protein